MSATTRRWDPRSRPLLVLLVALATAVPARAATADGELAEVIVTATLRPMPETHVAGSVTVLDGATLRQAGEQQLEDVLGLVPNLNWAGGSTRPRYFQLRGIGEIEQYEGAPNPSVGFLIDDVDFSGLGGAATLFDIDRIEVLRGPQGTRYGANALAGLIYVTSAAPEPEFGGRVEAGAGDYNTRSIGAVVTGPATALDSSFRLAAQRYTSDGYYYNDYLHRHDTNARDELTLRGRWRYQPADDLRVDLSVLQVRLDDGYDAFAPENGRTTHSDHPGVDAQHSTGASLKVAYGGLAAADLTAIATYADSRVRYGYDGDWGNPAYWAPYVSDFTELQLRHRQTASAELRLSSRGDAGLGWLAGAYAMRLRESFEDTSAGLSVDPVYGTYQQDTVITSGYRTDRVALFGVLDGRLSARLRWSGGLRGERQDAAYADALQDLVYGASTPHAFHPAETLWGGHASLSLDVGRSGTAYLQLARGYKAGGFNLSQGLLPAEITFRPESDWNLELGYKVQPAHGRWSLDADVYVLDRHDAQIKSSVQTDPTNPNTFSFYTGNAARGRNYGLETAARWLATRRIALGASLGLQHTRFTDFVRIADTGTFAVSRELAHAPHWNAAVNATYRHPAGFYARIDVSGVAGYYFDLPPNDTRSAAYGTVNLRLGWDAARWSASVWGRNLADRRYPVLGFYFGLEPPDYANKLYLQLGEPRTFGASVTIRFGAATGARAMAAR
jgi:iron complex outermembrane receptor protein